MILNLKHNGNDPNELMFFVFLLEQVAIKILDRNKLNHSTHKLLLREIKSIERLHHPNIIRLYEVIETPSEYYIATEYVPEGTLEKRITSEGKMSETDAKYFFAQLTAAVEHMVRSMKI